MMKRPKIEDFGSSADKVALLHWKDAIEQWAKEAEAKIEEQLTLLKDVSRILQSDILAEEDPIAMIEDYLTQQDDDR